ncbi:MAG TPA: hypothetical protein VKQ30_12280, partial [Ktedonobacterales bacterium]|nr:hypothetical protein [Ktedonobacterales bacterium]
HYARPETQLVVAACFSPLLRLGEKRAAYSLATAALVYNNPAYLRERIGIEVDATDDMNPAHDALVAILRDEERVPRLLHQKAQSVTDLNSGRGITELLGKCRHFFRIGDDHWTYAHSTTL